MPDGTEPVDPEPADPEPTGLAPGDDASNPPEHTRAVVRARRWIAPLPPPDEIEFYERALPGSADRIFVMAENEQQRRIAMEKAAIEAEKAAGDREQYALETSRKAHADDSSQSRLGLIVAFIIALAGLGAGAYLIDAGFGGLSLAVIFAPLAALVGVFVYADRSRRAERRRNARDE